MHIAVPRAVGERYKNLEPSTAEFAAIYGSTARAHGQLRPVASPKMALAGVGVPDFANCAFVNSTTASSSALGTHMSPAADRRQRRLGWRDSPR